MYLLIKLFTKSLRFLYIGNSLLYLYNSNLVWSALANCNIIFFA